MASNPDLLELSNTFQLYYNNFFFDNKNVIRYLENISREDSTDNIFDSTSKKILRLEINKNANLLFYDQQGNTELYRKYSRLLRSITESTQTLYYIIKNTTDYFDIYGHINIIKLVDSPPENDVVPSLRRLHATDATDATDANVTKYMVDGDTLYIYKRHMIAVEFNKINYKAINMGNSIDDVTIISNYLKFITSFHNYNLKTQLYAFYYYIILLNQFFNFYYNSEKLLVNGSDSNLCNYFDNIFLNNLLELKGAIDTLLHIDETSILRLDTKCTNRCPVTLDLIYPGEEYAIYVDNDTMFEESYMVVVDDTEYEILTAYYDTRVDSYRKKLLTLVLKANSNDSSCQTTGQMPVLDIMINASKSIAIRAKNIADMKRDYILAGQQLKITNVNIEKSKDVINKLVKNYDAQESINKSLDTRIIVYYVLFILILIICAVVVFGTYEESFKNNVIAAILVTIMLLIGVNYYFRYDYIEHFTNVDVSECNSLIAGSAVANRLNFVQNNITLFMDYVKNILVSFNVYLSSLDSIDLFKKLSGAIKNEKEGFKKHETIYKYKEHINKKSVDIMKHDMIYKTAFLDMVTYMVLICILLLICVRYNAEYTKLYLICAGLLIVLNLYLFYYNTLHPVRTRARNKYWSSKANVS